MNITFTAKNSSIDGLPPIFTPDQGVNPKSLIPPVITTPAYDLEWSQNASVVPSFINKSSKTLINDMDTPWETSNYQSRIKLDETKYNIIPRTSIMSYPDKVLREPERRLFLQTISPGEYIYNQEIYPLNSNIGISYTPQDPPLFKDPLFYEGNDSGSVIYSRIDPQFLRDNVPDIVKDTLPKRNGKTAYPSHLNAVSSPNFQTDRYLMESVDATYNPLPPDLYNVGINWQPNYTGLPEVNQSKDIYTIKPAEREIPTYSNVPLNNIETKTPIQNIINNTNNTNNTNKTTTTPIKDVINNNSNGMNNNSNGMNNNSNGMNNKESFSLYNIKEDCVNPRKSYLRDENGLMSSKVYHTLDQPPLESIYDSRWTTYGDPSRAYSDVDLGNVQYYYQDVDPYYKPNYIIRSKIDHVDFIDPMDRTLPEYYPSYSLEDMKGIAEEAYMRDTIFHREDMMAQLSKKMLQKQWQTRYAPLRRDAFKRS